MDIGVYIYIWIYTCMDIYNYIYIYICIDTPYSPGNLWPVNVIDHVLPSSKLT